MLSTVQQATRRSVLCRRFRNRALGDTVYRVGRDRPRKYAPDDRLIGSLQADCKAGTDPKFTIRGITAGLYFSATDESGNRFPADVEFDRMLKQTGIRGLFRGISGLTGKDEWENGVLTRIEEAALEYGFPPARK